jgi:hypothetical protein
MEFHELQQIVESNSRAIQSMLDNQASDRLQRAELQAAVVGINEAIQRLTTLNEGVVNLLSSLDEDRPTILRKLSTIENKVDRLLERRNGDQPQL